MQNELNTELKYQNIYLSDIIKDINALRQLNSNYESQNLLRSI